MSSNTNIGNTPVNQGYVQLIHTGETGGIDGTLRTLYDGDGTASDLQIASNKVKISTQLYIGSKTITEYVQDVVGDMLDTNGSHTNITATYDDAGDGAIDLVATGAISSIIGGTGIDATGSGDITIAIDSTVATLTGTQTLSNKTLASPTFTGTANGVNITLSGDLTVNGTTTTVNQTNLDVSDNIIGLNRGAGSNANDSGLIIERGSTGNNVFIGWKETSDRVLFGTTLAEADDTGDLTIADADIQANRLYGDVTGNVTGSASLNLLISNNLSDLASASTARSNLGVDAAGTDNSTDVTLAGSLDYITLSGQEITRNAIDLTTDVTGVLPSANLDADTAHLSGTQTFSGAKTFSSTITGSITGNAGTATALATARSITMSGEVSSGAVNFDGSGNVTIPNTTIGSGVIVDGSIASDASIATSKLASNTISGVALGSNLNALTVGTGMAFATGSDYTGATARQITLNLSAIDHDSLGNYVEEKHIDWTIDQGATNIHAGNYTDTNTNQLTTFVIQDGDTTNVTIDQGKYVKFQALTNGGLDIDWASSLGAGSSGDPYDLQFKIDLSNMISLVDTLESGDNLLVYNADEGTALAPVSEIQSALNIPSASGTTDGVVTLNANGTLTGEANLTFDGTDLAIAPTGKIQVDKVEGQSNNTNALFLDDDQTLASNMVSLQSVNHINIMTDGNNNGTGDFRVYNGSYDTDTADLAFRITSTSIGVFSNDVYIPATKKLYLDGGSDTYIDEPSGDQLRLVAGGTEILKGYSGGAIDMYGGSTTSRSINIGANRSGNGYSWIDLVGDATYTNYGARFIRNNGGANTSSEIIHRGTGVLALKAYDAGSVRFYTSNTERVRIDSSGNVGIGNIAPSNTFEVKSGSTTPFGIKNGSNSTRLQVSLTNDDADIFLYDRNTTLQTALRSEGNSYFNQGNVGIGTASPISPLHISKETSTSASSTGTTLLTLTNDVGADLNQQKTFVDFTLLDDNANETPQVRIGAEVGQNGDANSQEKEGSGAFVVYTNNADTTSGDAGASLAERMRVDYQGNVGIGTQTPTYELDVAGDIGVDHVIYHNGDGNTYHQFTTDRQRFVVGSELLLDLYEDGTQDYVKLGDGGDVDINLNDDMFVEGSSGNVGIGTISPQRKLHVSTGNTDIAARFENTTSNGSVAEFISSGDSRTLTIQTDHIYSNGNLFFGLGNYTNTYRAGTHIFQEDTGNTEVMRITGNNVGIGTQSPSAKFHVDGSAIFDTDTGNQPFYLTRLGSTDQALKMYVDDNSAVIESVQDETSGTYGNLVFIADSGSTGAVMDFKHGTATKMRLEAHSGNLGIGNVSPSYKLDVAGDARITSGSLGVGVTPNATDGRGDFSNDVVAYSTSDKRLKENIKPLDSALDKVLKISGVSFDWKELTEEEKKTIHGNEGHDVGVIAQEIEEVLPEVVTTRDNGYKAVKYEKIVPLLIEAIKEQQKQIEELKNG